MRKSHVDNYLKTFTDMSAPMSRPCGLHELSVAIPYSNFYPNGLSYSGMNKLKLEFARSGYSSIVEETGEWRMLHMLPPHIGSISKLGYMKLVLSTKDKKTIGDCNESVHGKKLLKRDAMYDEEEQEEQEEENELYNRAATLLMKDVLHKSTWMGSERLTRKYTAQEENNGYYPELDLYCYAVNDFLMVEGRPLENEPALAHGAEYVDLNLDELKTHLLKDEVRKWIAEEKDQNGNNLYANVAAEYSAQRLLDVKGLLTRWQKTSKDAKRDYPQNSASDSEANELMRQVRARSRVQVGRQTFASHTFWHVLPARLQGDHFRSVEVTISIDSAVSKRSRDTFKVQDDTASTTKRREPRDKIKSFHDVLFNLSAMLDSSDFNFDWLEIEGLTKLAHLLRLDDLVDQRGTRNADMFNGKSESELNMYAKQLLKLYFKVADNLGNTRAGRLAEEINSLAASERNSEMDFYVHNDEKGYAKLRSLLTCFGLPAATKSRRAALRAIVGNDAAIDTSSVEEYKYTEINLRTRVNGCVQLKGDRLFQVNKPLMKTEVLSAENAHDLTRAAVKGVARLFYEPVGSE
jgi:hypothetical protein